MSDLHPTFWRTCRVLAHEKRLALLWTLFEEGEGSVTALGARVGLREPIASLYLRSLNSRGLVQPERRSSFVFYRPMANPEVAHAAAILGALKSCHSAGMEHERVIRHLTAFTHERRISIARALKSGDLDDARLSAITSISPQALYRHVRKLGARGYVERRGSSSRLLRSKEPFPRALLKIVLD